MLRLMLSRCSSAQETQQMQQDDQRDGHAGKPEDDVPEHVRCSYCGVRTPCAGALE
jgi:hypothetical protein